MEDQVEELKADANEEVNFVMESGKYHPDFYEAVWRLLDLRVAIDKINPVLDVVLGLVKKRMVRHPARSTLMDMSAARVSASHLQVAEVREIQRQKKKKMKNKKITSVITTMITSEIMIKKQQKQQ